MLQQLNIYFQLFTEFAKVNPIVAGLVSIWGAGILTMVFKGVPSKVFKILVHQCTTTLKLNNADTGSNSAVFIGFISWLNNSKWAKYSRTMMVDGYNSYYNEGVFVNNGVSLGIGEGLHFFMKGFRPFWVIRNKIEGKQQFGNIFYEVSIIMLGRNRDVLKIMYDEFKPKKTIEDLVIHTYNSDGGWSRLTSSRKRRLETVVTTKGLKENLIKRIDEFKNNREWYYERGIPYKLVIILHGNSGTGKTSLVKSLAGHYDSDIGLLDLNSLSASGLQSVFTNVPANTFVLCEDFDSCDALKKRKGVQDVRQLNTSPFKKNTAIPFDSKTAEFADTSVKLELSTITLSTILNAFDGVVSLDNVIVFLTTNVLDDIDPAFYRPGRVDYIVEVGYLEHEDIIEYIELMFPGTSIPEDVKFQRMPGCVIQDHYFNNKNDYKAFMAALQVKESTDTIILFDKNSPQQAIA